MKPNLDFYLIIEAMRKQGFKIEFPDGKKHLDPLNQENAADRHLRVHNEADNAVAEILKSLNKKD